MYQYATLLISAIEYPHVYNVYVRRAQLKIASSDIPVIVIKCEKSEGHVITNIYCSDKITEIKMVRRYGLYYYEWTDQMKMASSNYDCCCLYFLQVCAVVVVHTFCRCVQLNISTYTSMQTCTIVEYKHLCFCAREYGTYLPMCQQLRSLHSFEKARGNTRGTSSVCMCFVYLSPVPSDQAGVLDDLMDALNSGAAFTNFKRTRP